MLNRKFPKVKSIPIVIRREVRVRSMINGVLSTYWLLESSKRLGVIGAQKLFKYSFNPMCL